MSLEKVLPMPRYLVNLDSVFTEAWHSVIDKLPFSVINHSPEKNSVTYVADINQDLENNVGHIVKIEVTLSWWDQCKNGHNSFFIRSNAYIKLSALNSDLRKEYYHLTQEDVDRYFPQLKKAYAYYRALFSPYGPLYYFENTSYSAGTKDCWGYEAGEQRKTSSGLLIWTNQDKSKNHYGEATSEFSVPRVGEGKSRDLCSARINSFWFDATDEQLSVSRAELLIQLANRLPGLMRDFKQFIEELGFEY